MESARKKEENVDRRRGGKTVLHVKSGQEWTLLAQPGHGGCMITGG